MWLKLSKKWQIFGVWALGKNVIITSNTKISRIFPSKLLHQKGAKWRVLVHRSCRFVGGWANLAIQLQIFEIFVAWTKFSTFLNINNLYLIYFWCSNSNEPNILPVGIFSPSVFLAVNFRKFLKTRNVKAKS